MARIERTKAAIALKEAVAARAAADPPQSQNHIARLIGCDSGNLAKILAFRRTPGRRVSVNIATEFGIPVADWGIVVSVEDDDADPEAVPA